MPAWRTPLGWGTRYKTSSYTRSIGDAGNCISRIEIITKGMTRAQEKQWYELMDRFCSINDTPISVSSEDFYRKYFNFSRNGEDFEKKNDVDYFVMSREIFLADKPATNRRERMVSLGCSPIDILHACSYYLPERLVVINGGDFSGTVSMSQFLRFLFQSYDLKTEIADVTVSDTVNSIRDCLAIHAAEAAVIDITAATTAGIFASASFRNVFSLGANSAFGTEYIIQYS